MKGEVALLVAGVISVGVVLVIRAQGKKKKKKQTGGSMRTRDTLKAGKARFVDPRKGGSAGKVKQEKQSKQSRVAEARENGKPAFEELVAQATELKAAGKQWVDEDFPHDDSSLFVDPKFPPDNWLREGERGKPLTDVVVGWRGPWDFCITKRPMGKTEEGNPTWLYSDVDGDGVVSADEGMHAVDVVQGSLGKSVKLSKLTHGYT